MLNAKEGTGTTVGATVKLTGTLRDASDITILGTVEGEVISDNNVIIGETAKIAGPVTAKTISVSGYVRGSVVAFEKLEILSSGKIQGSINTDNLVIQSGAIFNGKSSMPASKEKVKEEETKEQTGKEENEIVDKTENKDQSGYELE